MLAEIERSAIRMLLRDYDAARWRRGLHLLLYMKSRRMRDLRAIVEVTVKGLGDLPVA